MASSVIQGKDGEGGGDFNFDMTGEEKPDLYKDYAFYRDYGSGRFKDKIIGLSFLNQGGGKKGIVETIVDNY